MAKKRVSVKATQTQKEYFFIPALFELFKIPECKVGNQKYVTDEVVRLNAGDVLEQVRGVNRNLSPKIVYYTL